MCVGGPLLQGGAGSIRGTAAGLLVLAAIANVINQIGTLDANFQTVVSGAFLALVVTLQTYLGRTQRFLDKPPWRAGLAPLRWTVLLQAAEISNLSGAATGPAGSSK